MHKNKRFEHNVFCFYNVYDGEPVKNLPHLFIRFGIHDIQELEMKFLAENHKSLCLLLKTYCIP